MNLINTFTCTNCHKVEKLYTTQGDLPRGWIELTIKANQAGDVVYPTFDKAHLCSYKCLRETMYVMESYVCLLAEA